jgi:hypothetical protein
MALIDAVFPPRARLCLLSLAAASLVGCASWPQATSGAFDAPASTRRHTALSGPAQADVTTQACTTWFDKLDDAVAAEGKRDAGDTRIEGFAYLRVNRFLAALGQALLDEARHTPSAQHLSRVKAWAQHLARVDAQARDAELHNLSAGSIASLTAAAAAVPRHGGDITTARHRGGDITQATMACRDHLLAVDLPNPQARQLLLRLARVPDDYSAWQRWAGLYAVTKLPFFAGVQRWQDDAQARLAAPHDASAVFAVSATATAPNPTAAPTLQFRPAPLAGHAAVPPKPLPRDLLGVPVLTPAQAQALLWQHAPVFAITPTGPFDNPGALRWAARDDITPQVDPSQAVVYQRLSHTLWGGHVRLQLVYTVWFSERPLDSAWDLLGGKLDGVTWRVTLGESLQPLMHDTMHPCGCYHMFFPMQGVEAKPPPNNMVEWAFTPLPPLPQPSASAVGTSPPRLLVQLSPRTHDVVGVRYTHDKAASPPGPPPNVRPYRLVNDNTLRGLALADGSHRSIFDEQGIVPGTDRAERYVFWPMGIANPGAMRQWGRHATAFVGRRHFDDADLLDLRFTPPTER